MKGKMETLRGTEPRGRTAMPQCRVMHKFSMPLIGSVNCLVRANVVVIVVIVVVRQTNML